MNTLTDIYNKSLEENERNLHFWEDYLQNLKSLNFNIFSEKLSVPILIPIGNRIMFRGQLKHTNEITVALGSDYFAKCSVAQAEVLRQHRIKDAQSKVDIYIKEREYLENQMFSKNNLLETQGQEIVEAYTEEEDKAWRVKHRENVKKYKQEEKMKQKSEEDVTDNDLWSRLEELELQEELLNELEQHNSDNDINHNEHAKSFIIKEKSTLSEHIQLDNEVDNMLNTNVEDKSIRGNNENMMPKNVLINQIVNSTPKIELLQQVINKQNELVDKLSELQTKQNSKSKDEYDLLSKLDEMEQLDELEDEMNRLDDIIEAEDVEFVEEDAISPSSIVQRRVSFADDDDSNTLELTFKHSTVEPCTVSYNAENGIQKPSDIYIVYSKCLEGSTSILKKSKYKEHKTGEMIDPIIKDYSMDNTRNETIIIKDIQEKDNEDNPKIEIKGRPPSLFKKKRMNSKS